MTFTPNTSQHSDRVDHPRRGKETHDSWANLKGGGRLFSMTGNGEQIRGTVSGLGSVIGLSSKEDFMILLNRNFS